MQLYRIASLTEVDARAWNALVNDHYPFLRHEFLLALETSEATSAKTGWIAQHLLLFDGEKLIALMPLYLKQHSRGEYVFDQQWASAFHQHGLAYYPKCLTAIPFTPCPGPRFCIAEHADATQILALLIEEIKALCAEKAISSWHCLFPNNAQLTLLKSLQLGIREGVQFQWFNKNYAVFDDFLQVLSASKRKMIKRERRRVIEQGVELIQIPGQDVSAAQWEIFFQFYVMTYLKKGSQPYLNLNFFHEIARTMGNQLLLIMAVKEGKYVGSALSFIGADTLFGRYWGCHEEFNSLHFEACYYQGIDYCIAHGLKRFDSGAQGEHKIARGFEPVTTYSTHWIKNPEFAKAIANFLDRERELIRDYKNDVASYLPFKSA